MKNTGAVRKFGKAVVRVIWDGKVYVTVVKSGKREETYLFGPLPRCFGFRHDSDYAFDITARAAINNFDAYGRRS